MSEAFVPGVGAVLSADIAVPEHDREVRFYSRVLGTGEHPLWRENDLMNNLGMPSLAWARAAPNMLTFRCSGCRTSRSPTWRPACSVRSISAGAS